MIKYYCDRCKKELFVMKICSCTIDTNIFAEKYHLCRDCTELVKEFIKSEIENENNRNEI